MSNKVELLYHHGELVGFIHYLMRKPDLNSNLSREFKKGEKLTLEEAAEEYMKIVDEHKDNFYHTHDSQVRENYKTGIIFAVEASEAGNVVYVSDYIPADGDPICQGCYWFDKEGDSRRCVRAASKKFNLE